MDVVRRTKREDVRQYTHDEQKRLNNPPVGLVTAETDHLNGRKKYQFDPHLDPELQWAGKKEGTSFEVDTVSLHVHERIDPLTIIKAIQRRELQEQRSLYGYFETDENNPPIRDAIEFYKHSQGWSNRMIAGDSLLVMNSLLEKEGFSGKVQMIYIDPPYGITYGSNFQPFVNQRVVREGKDEDLTQEPEEVKAFRDTWELGIHSYLSYLRDRLLLSIQLLDETGSCFVQISEENVHHVREIMDEVFGAENFVSMIAFVRGGAQTSGILASVSDYLLWYARDKPKCKTHNLLVNDGGWVARALDVWVEYADGKRERWKGSKSEVPKGARLFTHNKLESATGSDSSRFPIRLADETGAIREFRPVRGWSTNEEGVRRLIAANRLMITGKSVRFVVYLDDFPYSILTNNWRDTATGQFTEPKIYVVQTGEKVLTRCILMTTDPGDLVFDPTCGSGTTAYVAEKWGRRWVTCDTSRVALTLAKERLMTAIFDYYQLARPKEGVSSGFNYEKVAHVTLASITNLEKPKEVVIYDEPLLDNGRNRVTGPFTVEAVPSQRILSFEQAESSGHEADISISRSGETFRQNEWTSELLSSGIRGKGGQILAFTRMEPLGGTRWIQVQGQTKEGKQVVVSFGPPYAPLEQRQVELAIEEAQQLVPKPKLVIFASFQFDPEAAKDIDELRWPGVDVLKVQMNTDLLTSDLKKNKSSNEPFWLVGQPDIEVMREGKKFQVVVNGFDYYNTKTGLLESGDASKIAMWELDTDYDGRSLYPRQVFFPLSESEDGWGRLARNLKAEVDEELAESYRGNKSLPFSLGDNRQIAVKIIDDRGIESLRIVKVRE